MNKIVFLHSIQYTPYFFCRYFLLGAHDDFHDSLDMMLTGEARVAYCHFVHEGWADRQRYCCFSNYYYYHRKHTKMYRI